MTETTSTTNIPPKETIDPYLEPRKLQNARIPTSGMSSWGISAGQSIGMRILALLSCNETKFYRSIFPLTNLGGSIGALECAQSCLNEAVFTKSSNDCATNCQPPSTEMNIAINASPPADLDKFSDALQKKMGPNSTAGLTES